MSEIKYLEPGEGTTIEYFKELAKKANAYINQKGITIDEFLNHLSEYGWDHYTGTDVNFLEAVEACLKKEFKSES